MKYKTLLILTGTLALAACGASDDPRGFSGTDGGSGTYAAHDMAIQICVGYGDGVANADVKAYREGGAVAAQWTTDGLGWFDLDADVFDYTEEEFTFVATKGRWSVEWQMPDRPGDEEEFCLEADEDVMIGVFDTEWDMPSNTLNTLAPIDYAFIVEEDESLIWTLENVLESDEVAAEYDVLMFGDGTLERVEALDLEDPIDVATNGLREAIEQGTSVYFSGHDGALVEVLFPEYIDWVGDDEDIFPVGPPHEAPLDVTDAVLESRLSAVVGDSEAQRLVAFGHPEVPRAWLTVESVHPDVAVRAYESEESIPAAVSFQPFGEGTGTVTWVGFGNIGPEFMTPGARAILGELALRQ